MSEGISIVEVLHRSNVVGLVGNGSSWQLPSTDLLFWDDQKMSVIGKLSFDQEILSLKIRRDSFIVVMVSKIYIYDLSSCKLKDVINTFNNPKGLCCVNSDYDRLILGYPWEYKGEISVRNASNTLNKKFMPFDISVAYIEFNPDGSLIACASEKGTLIRIFNTETLELVYELRRGIGKAEISCIAFHPTSNWIACCSDKGTTHIYSIDSCVNNFTLNLAFMKKVLPKYFESQWSYAKFKIKEKKPICCFAKDSSTLIIITTTGDYYAVNYIKRGKCKVIQKENLVSV